MTVVLALLLYAVLLSTVGTRLLRRARWVARAPRLAIVAWLALAVSAVTSVVLGGVGVTLSVARVSGDLAEILRSCALALRHEYAVPGGALVAGLGAAVAALLVLRMTYCVVVALMRAAWQRRAHRRVLTMVGWRTPGLDAIVVEHEVPAAYCVPGGRREQVVVTSAAVGVLAGDELEAVIAHERAHLRGRHHLVAAIAAGLGRAVPFVPVFRVVKVEVDRLLELLADDVATRSCARLTVAEALLRVGAGRAPVGVLGAGGTSTAHRVHRLIGSEQPLPRLHRLIAAVLASVVLAAPLLVAAAPAFAVAQLDYCPVDQPHVHEMPHLHHQHP